MQSGSALKVIVPTVMAGLVIATLAGYAFTYPSTTKATANLKIGLFQSVDWLIFYVADSEGYFREQGLNFTMVNLAGGAVIAPAVQSGSVDIGISAVVPIVVARDKGFDFRFFAPADFWVYPPNFRVGEFLPGVSTMGVIVRKDSNVRSWKELEGRTVATNTLGTVTQYAVQEIIHKSGGDPKKISFVPIPFPNMQAAVEQGRVDAANMNEPWLTASLISGNAKILGDASALTQRWLTAGYFSTSGWIESHPEEVRGFVRASEKAVDFIKKNPKKTREILASYTMYPKDLAEKVALYTYESKITPLDVQFSIDLARRWGGVSEKLKVTDIIDSRYMTAG